MNLPNKLTVLRVILVPFFVFFLLGADWIGSFSPYIALIIFIVASLTDMLDGKIARKYNLITNFGNMGCSYYHFQRIYYQRLPSCCC